MPQYAQRRNRDTELSSAFSIRQAGWRCVGNSFPGILKRFIVLGAELREGAVLRAQARAVTIDGGPLCDTESGLDTDEVLLI
jgi:hypothetical protein